MIVCELAIPVLAHTILANCKRLNDRTVCHVVELSFLSKVGEFFVCFFLSRKGAF